MDDREAFDTQQEAKRGVAGEVAPSTREQVWGGLVKYLNAEARHTVRSRGPEAGEGGKKRD